MFRVIARLFPLSVLSIMLAFLAAAAERPPDDVAAARHLETARHHARDVLPTIVAAVYPDIGTRESAIDEAARRSLGASLASYAANRGAEPGRHENFVDAAKRILAGGTTARRTPAATSRWLDQAADSIVAATRAADTTAGNRRTAEFEASLAELRATAHLARFHARRMIAAVHYNLFTRGLKLAELLAATMQEKEAVVAWRELVALGGDRDIVAQRTAELKNLQSGLRELEEQCCPPDEAILKEKVWDPTTDE